MTRPLDPDFREPRWAEPEGAGTWQEVDPDSLCRSPRWPPGSALTGPDRNVDVALSTVEAEHEATAAQLNAAYRALSAETDRADAANARADAAEAERDEAKERLEYVVTLTSNHRWELEAQISKAEGELPAKEAELADQQAVFAKLQENTALIVAYFDEALAAIKARAEAAETERDLASTARDAAEARVSELTEWRPTHRHKKRGSEYTVVGQAKLQCSGLLDDMEPMTVYRGQHGELWVRPRGEFEDGRFEPIAPPSTDGGSQ